jgi:4-alpha-glucanotransferase
MTFPRAAGILLHPSSLPGAGDIGDDASRAFVVAHDQRLPDYALCIAIKEAHGGAVRTDWEPGAALREPVALAAWRAKLVP